MIPHLIFSFSLFVLHILKHLVNFFQIFNKTFKNKNEFMQKFQKLEKFI